MNNIEVRIFTDGACSGNPGIGGWSAILQCLVNGSVVKEKIISGFADMTTNNKMELTAVIKAMQALKKNIDNITIFSDSQYVVSSVNAGWLNKWKNNSWKTADKKAVKNCELWQEFDNLLNQYPNIKFEKVQGHIGIEYNEMCDRLARKEITKRRESI